MHIGVREPRIRALLRRLLQAGLSAADPALAVRRKVTLASGGLCIGRRRYDFHEDSRVLVVGAGKASARMAHALEDLLGSRLDGGLVVVKYAHRVPTRRVELAEAGHPLPDRAGQKAASRLLSLVKGLLPNDLLLVLLSGGASSLLPAPAPGVTLADKQRTSALLLRSGANIHEINTVRKHLSSIKGGRLAASTRARVVSLILSDVIGDDLATIGSGPTAPDPTTYADACRILRRFHIWTAVPRAVRQHLTKGRQGRVRETPKPRSSVFKRVQNVIIGSNRASVQAVAREAQQAGLRPLVLSASMTGEAKEAAREFGAIAKQIASVGKPVRRPACVIAG
ncbi:MAG: glycerate kinase, partial [Nitrospiraceae bacterium]